MLWCVMYLQLLSETPGFWCRKCFIERGKNMCIEIIHHQNELLGMRVVHINHFPHETRPIFLRSVLAGLDDAFPCQRFDFRETRYRRLCVHTHNLRVLAFLFPMATALCCLPAIVYFPHPYK